MLKRILKEIIQIVVPVIVLTFILLNFVLLPVKVQGDSMFPTLVDDEFGYSFIITRNLGINRFDIVVIEVEDKLLVKRVIGMPNETIEYINNELYIDGEYYEEDFLDKVTTEDFSFSLGEDEYYCLGDNRNVSKDSRFYGPFKKEDIKASKIFVIFPFNNFGLK